MQTHVPLSFLRRYIYGCSRCIIGSKTLLAERGKLPPKLTCPAGTYTCPATRLNKGYTARTLPKTLLAERGKLGSCSAWPIAVFCQILLQQGKWLCCILVLSKMSTQNFMNAHLKRHMYKGLDPDGLSSSLFTVYPPAPQEDQMQCYMLDNQGVIHEWCTDSSF